MAYNGAYGVSAYVWIGPVYRDVQQLTSSAIQTEYSQDLSDDLQKFVEKFSHG